MKNLYTAFFLLFISFLGYSQADTNLLVETATNKALVVCGDEIEFTIKMTNLTTVSTGGILSSIVYESTLPNGVTFVSSESLTNEATSSNKVKFTIPDISNATYSFKYKVKGDCSLLTDFNNAANTTTTFKVVNKNTIYYKVNSGNSLVLSGSSESFNVNYPELFVKVKTQDVNVTLGLLEKDADGSVFEREIEVSNSGLGNLSKFQFYIDYDPRITFNKLKLATGLVLTPIGSEIVSPLNSSLRRITYEITDFSQIGNKNNLFEQNEKLIFMDNVALFPGDCYSQMVTNYTAVYGCQNTFCEDINDKDATSLSYLTFNQGNPRLVSVNESVGLPLGSFCGGPIKMRMKFTNVGTGSTVKNSDTAFDLLLRGTSDIFKRLGVNRVSLNGNLIFQTNKDGLAVYQDDFSLFSVDPDGTGGLADVDLDGKYDDLPVGATVIFDVELNLEWDSNVLKSVYNLPIINLNLAYKKNSCENNGYYYTDYSSSNFSVSSYENNAPNANVPKELASGDTKVFTFSVDYNYLLRPNLGSVIDIKQNYLSRFTLPYGYSIISVVWVPKYGSAIPLIPIGNQVNGGGYSGKYEVTVKVIDCREDGIKEGIEDIKWDMFIDVCNDYSTEETFPIAHTTSGIFTSYETCPDSSGGGGGTECKFETSSFNADRTTFGYVEGHNGLAYYTKDQLAFVPKVDKNTPGVNLDIAYPLDAIKVTAEGISGCDPTNNIIFEFAFNLPEGFSGELLSHKTDGKLVVGGVEYPITAAQLQTRFELGGKRLYYKYTIPASISGSVSLEVKDLELQFKKNSDIKLSKGLYSLPVFRGKFYGNTIDPTQVPSKGTSFDLLIPVINTYNNGSNFECSLQLIGGFYVTVNSATGGDDFKNEYRPLVYFNETKFTLPEGFQVNSEVGKGSTVVDGYNGKVSDLAVHVDGNTVTILPGGFIVNSAEEQTNYFLSRTPIVWICKSDQNQIPPNYNTYPISSSYINTIEDNPQVFNITQSRYFFNETNRLFSSSVNQVQEGFERKTDWPVQYCNLNNNRSIDKAWIALELKDEDASTILIGANNAQGSPIANENIIFYGPINPRSGKPRNMLVRVPVVLGAGVCTTIYPIAEYRVCQSDVEQDIDMISSFACPDWPFANIPDNQLSTVSSILKDGLLGCLTRKDITTITLRYKTGNLNWEVNRVQDAVDVCEPLDFEIKVASTKFANVYDTKVAVDLPAGVTLNDANSISYTYDGSNYSQVPSNFIEQNVSSTEDLIINTSDLVTSLLVASGDLANAQESTIPGIRLPGKNEITFKLKLNTNCTYDPGNAIQFNLKGTTNCSDAVDLSFDRFVPIKGLVLPKVAVDILADNFMLCDDLNEVTLVVENKNTDLDIRPIENQELILTLPVGVSYASTVAGFLEPTIVSGNTLSWNLTDLDENIKQTFKINTKLNSSNANSFKYQVKTRQNGKGTCVLDNKVCDLEVTTASDFIEVANMPFPAIEIKALTSRPVCEGSNVVVEVLLSGGSVPGAFTYNWNGVKPISSSGNQFTFKLLNTTKLEVTVGLASNASTNCSTKASIDVEVYPGATLAMTLIEGVSCAGMANAKLKFSITGESGTGYVDQAPFTIVSTSHPNLVTIGKELASGEEVTVTNLPEGYFTATLKDNYGCIFTKNIYVSRIGSPIGDFCTTLLNCGEKTGDVEMSFETLNLHSSITGTSYIARVYATSGAQTDILNFTGSFTDKQKHLLTNVNTSTVYVLEIKAANGCEYTRSFTIQALKISPSITNPKEESYYEVCFINDKIDLNLAINNNIVANCTTFRIPNYTVTYGIINKDKAFIEAPLVFNNVGGALTLEQLGIGNYKVIVTPSSITNYDNPIAACESEYLFEIKSKSSFAVKLISNDPICYGANGDAQVVVTGRSGDVTYEWTNIGTGEILSTGYDVKQLEAGNYQVIVTDVAGCGSIDPLTFEIKNPDSLAIPIIEDVQTSCAAIAGSGTTGGSASGYDFGKAPYKFVWYEVVTLETPLQDGTISITKVDQMRKEEIVQENGVSVFDKILPGNYKVEITDANGCKVTSIETAITEPPVIRKYNICLSWLLPSESENADNEIKERPNPPFSAIDIRNAISTQVERCVVDSQDRVTASANEFLNNADRLVDAVILDYKPGASLEYQFTLYYYDRAGNLVRTVPPEGVRTVNGRVPTAHTYVTGYDYNSIAQLASQNTPDGGSSQFAYNDIGQLWYSQNERQQREKVFSYMTYDELGRVLEGGEAQLKGKTFPVDFLLNNQANPQIAFDILEADKVEYIQTTYNDAVEEITYQGQGQRYLNNNVSFINNKDKNGKITKTYYSYDPHGNVEWCIQELPELGRTTVGYSYDLVSGNVNEVCFNKGRIDEYRHKYSYDEDNRIIAVKTSKDGYIWDEDARYDYYLHGPLSRAEIGEDKVQGLDFTYTIHGWLKGINTPNLAKDAFNPDGSNKRGDEATKHAKDEFGMALGYYRGDFTRDGVFNSGLTAANPFNLPNQSGRLTLNLYNGNISTWTSQVAKEAKDNNRTSYLTGNAYRYDELNRIKSATTQLYSETNNNFGAINGNDKAFMTYYDYDKNGNLKNLHRHKDDGQLMDDLEYHYDLTSPNLSNKLTHVKDKVGQISAEINDLPNQADGNYKYDEIGQLIRDNSEGLTYVWTAAGKVSEIIPDNTGNATTQKVHMSFTYDGMGMRAIKQVNRLPYNSAGAGPKINKPEAVETTYYSYDPSGNLMGVYKREDVKVNPADVNDKTYSATFKITERPIYGSTRVGQDVYEETLYTRVYAFDSIDSYKEVAVGFINTITNALGTVLLVQNNDQELTDVDGNPITVAATTMSVAKTNKKAFNALEYVALQQENNAVVPIKTDNNIFLIEDSQGDVLSYGVVAQNYFSTATDRGVLLIYNKEGQLVPGLETINADGEIPIDPQAKTVVVKHPSNPNEYLLFYRDKAAGLHCATLRNSGGLTITKHQNFAYSNYGRHMAIIQDEKNKKAYLYATMHGKAVIADDGTITSPAGINLVRFTIDEAGVTNFDGVLLPTYFDSFDAEGNGELQIALDGTAISLYHNTTLPTQWTASANAEIRTWKLDPKTMLPIANEVQVVAVTNGNIGKGSLINTGSDIYYTQHTQEVSTSIDNKIVKRASDGAIVTTNGLGDLRVNKDNKLYQFTSTTNSGQEWNLETQTVTALNNLPASTYGTTGFQPYQSYTILKEAEEATSGLVYRYVGNKNYEINDHLGNVRVVVGDRKELDPITGALTASVVSFSNYYPFGMLMPNRHSSSKDYRYGFQGQEKDDEIKGEGNSLNYTYRMHDPRIGRFFAIDPLEAEFPFYSPYQFSSNSPIMSVELEGLETSTLVNETEKKKAEQEHGAVKTWVTLRVLDFTELFINVGRLTQGKPLLKYPILEANPEENLESVKSVYNTTFEVMSIWETAKYGIGGTDDDIWHKAGSVKSSGAVNKSTTSVVGRAADIDKLSNMVKNSLNPGGYSRLSNNKAWDQLISKYSSVTNSAKKWARINKEWWDVYNKPWLDDIIKRGDIIKNVSNIGKNVRTNRNLYNIDGSPTHYKREVDYLIKNNYSLKGEYWVKQ